MLRRGARSDDESGFVLLWISLMMVMLLVIAALAIEVGNWYAVRNKLQHNADTAALAGAVLMPDLVQASNAAFDNLARNGVCDRATFNPVTRTCTGRSGTAKAKVDPVPNDPSKVRVTVWQTITNHLGALVGVGKTTVSRTAVAAYQGPIAMGSPVNTLGDQPRPDTSAPAWSAGAAQGQFWLNIAGWKANKSNGDRYSAGKCGTSSGSNPAELCADPSYNDGTSTGANNGGGEWDGGGYVFPVKIAPHTAGTLAVEAFDPALVYVGDTCDAGDVGLGFNLPRWWTSRYPQDRNLDPNLYQRGLTPFCTGDQDLAGANAETLFALHAPDDTPSYTDNPLVTSSGCTPRQFGAYDGRARGNRGIKDDLEWWRDPDSGLTLREEFRKWVRVCTVNVNNDTDYPQQYLLRVSTALAYNPTTRALVSNPNFRNEGGHNRYALRAGWVDGSGNFTSGANASLFAGGRLPIYANRNGATTQFYLSEVRPGPDGRTLQVDFWDTGDANGAGDITLIPPAGATYTAADGTRGTRLGAFSGCSLRFGAGVAVQSRPNCSVHIDNDVPSTNGNGRLISLYVPIPLGYSCGTSSGTDCWIRTQFAYASRVQVNDTTTWSATINGEPTRITE